MTSPISVRSLFLTPIMLLAAAVSTASAAESLTITRVSGSVKVAVDGREVAVRAGSTVNVPARIETGADGSLQAEQASSTLDVGPNSVVLLPGVAGRTVEKIIQNRGRVLYSVKPRKARTFSVETPYLVSVVKGTMFTVAIDGHSTAVSLLEGSVELVADGIEPILLQPNETASRSEGARAITVTKIDMTPPAALPQAQLNSPANGAASSSLAADASITASTLTDLNEITAAQRVDRPTTPTGNLPSTPTSPVDPSVPGTTPEVPSANPSPTTPTPGADPTPVPVPVPVPVPTDDDDDDCGKKHCDGDDDNHGGGNDKD